jgi:5'-phosphate synthase pdxT subunit
VALVGVLALQGDYQAHIDRVAALDVRAVPVRTADELHSADALILPGGESTAMLRLMEPQGLLAVIRQRVSGGMPLLATCAGVILAAREVEPSQESLGVLDITVRRNAYGRQLQSSVETLRSSPDLGGDQTMEGVFIRAPRILALGEGVFALAHRGGEPVLVQQGAIIAATFHPELTADERVHRRFVDSIPR